MTHGGPATWFARDQYNEPWIMFERSGSTWAMGLDADQLPIIRFAAELRDNCGWTIHTDLYMPRGIRNLTRVDEGRPSRRQARSSE